MAKKYALLVFPNNLFEPKLIRELVTDVLNSYNENKDKGKNKNEDKDKNKNSSYIESLDSLDVIMVEHPVFWGQRLDRPRMNFNPLKLVYHRASMYHWYNKVIADEKPSKDSFKFKPSKYISCSDFTLTKCKNVLAKYDNVFYFDPCDKQLDTDIPDKLIGDTKTKKRSIQLASPLFYNTLDDLAEFHKSNTKDGKKQATYTHASFYKWMRKRVEFLPGTKTYDTENRDKMPVDTKVPALPTNGFRKSDVSKALRQGSTAVPDKAKLSRSDVLSRLVFPIDRESSIEWLRHFCKNRLKDFGKYQDAIDCKGRCFLFHSCISPMLNIGIITPCDVVKEVQKYYESHKSSIPVASYEGFMRQIVGWREYQRYLYQYAYNEINGTNHFGNRRRLPSTSSTHNPDPSDNKNPWYTGSTGIPPVDDAIKQAWNTGYMHHIQRLMVVGNIMNLIGVHPDDVYRWYMEFALDSYDWVMVGNVYSMAMWSDAGVSMRKPYISSDSYIMKMSEYKRGEWNDIWYALFYDFVQRNSKQLSSTYYAGMVKNWNKKSSSEKKELKSTASKFIKSVTNSS